MLPHLFHYGHVYLPTFGVLAALGLMLALLLSEKTARLAEVDADKLWDAGIFAVIAAFAVSRALLVATHWKTFVAFPVLLIAVPSLPATGLLLTVIATCVWLRVKRVPLLRAFDAWAPSGALVWSFLALGHFAEGSDPGMPTTLPWGVRAMAGDAMRLHPVALYVAVIAAVLAVIAYAALKRGQPAGAVAGWTLAWAGGAQFLLTFVRQPGAMAAGGLERLQCVALAMLVAGVALVTSAFLRPEVGSSERIGMRD